MQKNIKKNKARKGFTLVELIVVIAILAVLAAAAIAGYAGVTQNARDAQARSNAATICNAVNNHNTVATTSAITGTVDPATATTFSALTGGTTATTWDMSVENATTVSSGSGTLNTIAPGPVDLDLAVTMTPAEWTAAMAVITVSNGMWMVP